MDETKLAPETRGAWILHHQQKLAGMRGQGFEQIVVAGKVTRLLSAISSTDEATLPIDRVRTLARANGLSPLEVDSALGHLKARRLIDTSATGVAVLGVSQRMLPRHAAGLFDTLGPDPEERASIVLAELASRAPIAQSESAKIISDQFSLPRPAVDAFFEQSEAAGFVDYEGVEAGQRIYFNGNLFRRESAEKAQRILSTLTLAERAAVLAAEDKLSQSGCLLRDELIQMLGPPLWGKLLQIGYFDESTVTNEFGDTGFVTRPAALSKFASGDLADELDNAKALASGLAYGIMRSTQERGRIRDRSALLAALVDRGYVEGRARALVEDYKPLEFRGVVKVASTARGYRMDLLKRDVGEMARALILHGDANDAAVEAQLRGAAAMGQFDGPEHARTLVRAKRLPENSAYARRALDVLRKG